ncbi:hypothetical protein P3T43_006428 [Paraburkholderia sp. GAS41]
MPSAVLRLCSLTLREYHPGALRITLVLAHSHASPSSDDHAAYQPELGISLDVLPKGAQSRIWPYLGPRFIEQLRDQKRAIRV